MWHARRSIPRAAQRGGQAPGQGRPRIGVLRGRAAARGVRGERGSRKSLDPAGSRGRSSPDAYGYTSLLRVTGKTRRNEVDASRDLRDGLIEPSGMVAEGASHRVVRDDAEPDLIGDQHDRPGHAGQGLEQRGPGSVCRAAVVQEVAEPHRDAVCEQAHPGCALAPNRLRQIERDLHGSPVVCATRAMYLDPARHLVIDALGGCEEHT